MSIRILIGDALTRLRELPDESVHCCVTSPPYWGLRDYGVEGQIGLEPTPGWFVDKLVLVFAEVRRVLRADGTCWINLGDSYAGAPGGYQGKNGQRASRTFTARIDTKKTGSGLKPKDLVGIPWRVAFALQEDGWWLRSDIIWHKKNPMPESIRDRPTKAHEHVFLLAKSERYFYDAAAIREPGSPDSHARLARGRNIGWSPPGQPEHKGVAAARAPGVNPKAAKNARSGDNREVGFNERWRVKQNASFTEAISGEVLPDRNARDVWTIGSEPFPEAHFATFPPALAERCIKAGCPLGGTVLDPFGGAGTTGLVADRLQRDAVLIELNPEYARMAERRIRGAAPMFADVRVEAA